MEWIFFALAAALYIYRFISKTNKAAAEEAERRKRMNEETGKSIAELPAERAKTPEEVLAEVFKNFETKTKPFAQQAKPVIAKSNPYTSKTTTNTVAKPIQKSFAAKKREPVPFLTNDYSAESILPEGTPSHMMEDYIKKSELSDGYTLSDSRSEFKKNFNLRQAVIANVILTRPEW
ncbi:MAG: hypothetical protein LH473_04965 [Chitinophagales bacterium]|nr:hypothetical protein [Chitinophagales bacterium]